MRIVIIADPIDEQYAGVYYYTKHLIEALIKIDKENEYIFMHTRINDFFNNQKEVIIPNYRWLPGWMSLRKFVFISFALLKIKPDVVLEPAHIGPFSFFYKCKKVVTIHDLTPVLFPQYHIKISSIIHRLFLPLILRNADGVLVPSECTKKDIERLYQPKVPIQVTYEAVTEDFQPSSKKQIREVKDKFGIEKPYILSVGTLEPRKNLITLLKAYKILSEKGYDYQLVIVGRKGWYFKELLEEIENFGKDIIITGYVSRSELSAFYSGAEVMVFPSLYEGFGLPPLEAMQCGCPVICSNTSSLPEICGKAAILIDPNVPEDLQIALQKVLTDDNIRSSMRHEGIKQAGKFSWEKCARETLEFFRLLHNR
ncbi:MAG: glycosyltransferase family 4 protein [Armatimonadetes bacterium]|nr:glycosyltransferase family 4 protein [Armatimonadota bacterium]